MGCTASKLDNEDAVRRCKDRRLLMKEAVYARHHLAAAHADYCRSLRITGAALSSFAAGEPLSVSDQTPAVFLHQTNPLPSPYSPSRVAVPPSPSPSSIYPPPPPPFAPSPTTVKSNLPHILSCSSLDSASKYRQRKPLRTKLPHILSETSPASSPKSNFSANYKFPTAHQANSTYSCTPSQTSSVWNWENFYPPSPPDSEFFEHKTQAQRQSKDQARKPHHFDTDQGDDESEYGGDATETERSEYDFFKPAAGGQKHYSKKHDTDGYNSNYSAVGEETEREEVQCSEWEDHCSITTTSSDEEDDDRELRSEIGNRSNLRSEPVKQQQNPLPQQQKPAMYGKSSAASKSAKSDSTYRASEISDMQLVVRHKDLKEIVDAIKENFENAAAAGNQVSEMLEIGRAQLDRSFRQLRKTVYHSSSVFSNLSSSWTSKPPLAVKYQLDTGLLSEIGGSKSLCSTLERLLAWEKKLYEEIKAREGAKFEHEKKLRVLQNQEYKGDDEAKLYKTKTSIQKLQSIIIVTSQAVSTTSTAIIGLRDTDLVPQLVELCHGFMYMWRSMHQYHDIQNHIVQQVRGLVNGFSKGDATSELHRQATRDLESAVTSWHSSFCRLIKFQRDFIQSLHGWFKLTLIPVSSNDNNREKTEVYTFCEEWKLALDRVPDTVASEAIKSFINVVHVIAVKQTEEIKIRKRTESASKELEKKASTVRNIERKFYHSYSMVGIGLPDTSDNGQVLDARDPLAEKKSELASCQRRVEDEMLKHAKAVEVTRAMTLNNIQTGLPGVFQALTSFSALFTESMDTVCKHSYAIK